MSKGRKISVRKIIQTFVTLVAVAGCAVAMISADRQHANKKVKDVQLVVKSPSGVQFLTEVAVRDMLFTGRHLDPNRISLSKVDERSMEAILRANPWVKDAQVFTDAERIMHVVLTQRVPTVRLFQEDGNSYYLDAGLKAMPLSTQYTHYAPVVTGVPKLTSDSLSLAIKGNIVGLVNEIQKDTFWSALVSQINMREDGGFELVPVLGKQKIIIGDTLRLHEKLDALFAFYKQVHNKVGWDKYNTIDLRFKDQVVASPSLPWKVPVDRALSNMNWLKAIMENAPVHQGKLGGDAPPVPNDVQTIKAQPATAASPVAVQSPARQPAKAATTNTGVKPAKPPASLPVMAPKKKPVPQAATKPPKPKLPQAAGRTTNTTSQQSLKNTTRHKQNTPPHAATNR
jgi:cell division protein FtsQ